MYTAKVSEEQKYKICILSRWMRIVEKRIKWQ